ncbi:hypothetical protein HYH02_010986 [Chlamydomonas schloesseri]|uniref:5-formyltetrahydrofolate cyclo-ligase n=1 Tax=Chlamydomonas schloesseri TaxID=2026947 RepID=A0A835T8G6_9CHLO|nr:hypothetical protein HYH02_010986 [Chlamydomonas schloesseri]|eukprot:KAG2438288.1 hypothetical protein HYH02_010986 [Chlamydomonas schloesseri]
MSAAAMDCRELKQQARKDIKQALRGLTQEQMADESARIAARVLGMSAYTKAGTLGIYLHCAKLREVDTTSVLQDALRQGKRCYVPVVEDKNSNMKFLHLDDMACLRTVPPFDILEPTGTYSDGTPRQDALQSGTCFDLLLVPGLGFDTSGRRLGRGGGYYDKMITGLQQLAAAAGREPPLLAALSYSAQVVGAVPVDEHDQLVDVLVTAGQVYGCTARGWAALQGT